MERLLEGKLLPHEQEEQDRRQAEIDARPKVPYVYTPSPELVKRQTKAAAEAERRRLAEIAGVPYHQVKKPRLATRQKPPTLTQKKLRKAVIDLHSFGTLDRRTKRLRTENDTRLAPMSDRGITHYLNVPLAYVQKVIKLEKKKVTRDEKRKAAALEKMSDMEESAALDAELTAIEAELARRAAAAGE